MSSKSKNSKSSIDSRDLKIQEYSDLCDWEHALAFPFQKKTLFLLILFTDIYLSTSKKSKSDTETAKRY